MSASDCKCLPEQVSASDCPVNDRPQLHNTIASSREVASREAHPRVAARDECRSICPVALHCFFPAALPPSVGSVSQERQGTALCPHFTAGCFSGPAFVRWRLKEHSSLLQEAQPLKHRERQLFSLLLSLAPTLASIEALGSRLFKSMLITHGQQYLASTEPNHCFIPLARYARRCTAWWTLPAVNALARTINTVKPYLSEKSMDQLEVCRRPIAPPVPQTCFLWLVQVNRPDTCGTFVA